MTDRIAVGDLVQVVWPVPKCGCTHEMGIVFRVRTIRAVSSMRCMRCNNIYVGEARGATGYGSYEFDLRRLKRIPPLEELEGERTEENLKEPA